MWVGCWHVRLAVLCRKPKPLLGGQHSSRAAAERTQSAGECMRSPRLAGRRQRSLVSRAKLCYSCLKLLAAARVQVWQAVGCQRVAAGGVGMGG